jgi:hypothetical protein
MAETAADSAARIAAGYTFDGPALELGSVVLAGTRSAASVLGREISRSLFGTARRRR